MVRRTWLLAAMLVAAAGPVQAVQTGDRAPDFSLTSTDGERISLHDLAGNVVVMSFWASWGKQCGEQLRELQAIHEELGDRALVVLGINEREQKELAAEFAARNQVTYPTVLDDGAVARAFGVNGVPDVWVVDRRSIVRARFIGHGPNTAKWVREAVLAGLGASGLATDERPTAGDEGPAIPAGLRAYAHLQLGAAHVNIGDAFVKAGYRDAGHFDRALREFRSGLALDPGNVDLHIWLGLGLERKDDPQGAVREYQTALTLDPKSVYAQDALRRLGVPWRPTAPEEE